jgi:uncharacterized membrane protein YfcA
MDLLSSTTVALLLVALAAALVNGMIGYGFSSIVTPVAILWLASRTLNPALILVELGVNLALLVKERSFFHQTFPRTRPVILGLLPGVLVGTVGLALIAPGAVKMVLYLTLLPLILVQLMGMRRRILNEPPVGATLGAGVGALYSLTTISGPPLALFWRNQGLAKGEFRCALAQIRVAEASFTALAYLAFGLYTPESLSYVPILLIPVLLGVPLGAVLLQGFTRDFFSRIVMSADGLLVAFGLCVVLGQRGVLSLEAEYGLFLAAAAAIVALSWHELRKIPFLRVSPRFEDRSFGPGPFD